MPPGTFLMCLFSPGSRALTAMRNVRLYTQICVCGYVSYVYAYMDAGAVSFLCLSLELLTQTYKVQRRD